MGFGITKKWQPLDKYYDQFVKTCLLKAKKSPTKKSEIPESVRLMKVKRKKKPINMKNASKNLRQG